MRWEADAGAVLARFGGAAPRAGARDAAATMAGHGLECDVTDDDEALWAAQREGQRSESGTVVKVSARQSDLRLLLDTARGLGARVVGRAGLGLAWVTLDSDPVEGLATLRRALAPAPCVVLDAPPDVRSAVDVWGPQDPAALELMRRVKQRFDPAGVCAPGVLAV